jgi:antitoxin ParD1/3/4
MATITLSLKLAGFVDKLVQSGKFTTRDEAVTDALQKQMQREEELAWLKREVEIGIAQADRGELVEFNAEKIKAEGRKRLAARKQ